MRYKIKSSLIPPSWFEKAIFKTLTMYDKGKDLTNSPLIQIYRNWRVLGGMHVRCRHEATGGTVREKEYESCIQERQKDFIVLYESIKKRGYIDNEKIPILVQFDDNGYLHLQDGHHRLSILRYLNIEAEVTIETHWQGMWRPGEEDNLPDKDFPLVEKLKEIHHGNNFLYQWIPDERVKDFKCSRPDSKERLDYILKHFKGKTVLDIGCSEGYFSRELAKRGYKVTAVDTSRKLVAIARYLATIQNLKIDFQVRDWKDIMQRQVHFDNVLHLSVFHNIINSIGQQQAFKDLTLFRGKIDRMILEFPDVKVQPDWAYIFRKEVFDDRFQRETKLQIKDTSWKRYRPIYLLTNKITMEKKRENPILETKNGYKMVLPFWDFVTKEIRQSGCWEKRTTEFIKEHLKKGQTFVDVGAHAGYFTLLASKLVGEKGKVYAFEPAFKTCQMLLKNLKDNKCKNVQVFKKALSKKAGKTALFEGYTPGENTLIGNKAGKNLEMIDTVRYDDLSIEVPNMIKIDVEGAEKMVLEGMSKLLKTKKEIILIIEDWENKNIDWLVKNYGFEVITTDRAFGNYILVKNKKMKSTVEPLRCHLLGTFNTPVNKKPFALSNAFASKVGRMAQILKRLGYYVIFYGVEGSEVECDEFVQISDMATIEKAYGKWNGKTALGSKYGDIAYTTFNKNAIVEIEKRKRVGDFLLLCHGTYQKEIADAVKIHNTVEIGIGYPSSFARFRIFESYFQMHTAYATEKKGDGVWYDCVIPGYFDQNDFEYSKKKDDYFLYLGRVIHRKGIRIAQQVIDKIGAKLIVAGLRGIGVDSNVDLSSPNIEYVGLADFEKRKELISKAKAVFMPTIYLEPFGYVAIEAMMSGTPVITTDWGAFPETIQHGKTGYRCKTFEQFVWAAKNIDKIKPKDCRKWAMNNYSLEKATQMYQEYFNQILWLNGKGWYSENSNRKNLDSLNKIYA